MESFVHLRKGRTLGRTANMYRRHDPAAYLGQRQAGRTESRRSDSDVAEFYFVVHGTMADRGGWIPASIRTNAHREAAIWAILKW
jgi:hypothetical protein